MQMIALSILALIQLATPPVHDTGAVARADTSPVAKAPRGKRPPRRAEVTAQHLATAYHDAEARGILLLAREARLRQDSSLRSYDATGYQRSSAGLSLGRLGRERLAFRTEQATHIRWRRGIGAYVEITGDRTVVPIAGNSATPSLNGLISPVPYYPGSERLWIGASLTKSAVDENEGIVHPLAEGAEAYYSYASGDSVRFRLPDGQAVLLRELRVRPRAPQWNLAVGSLWFDMATGQLVRAAYRMAVPMDIADVARRDDPKSFDDVPALIKPLLFPMTAQVSAIGVEYGLFEGRFWLPRVQVVEGSVRVGIVTSPFTLEQRFAYSGVNAGAPLPAIAVATDTEPSRDSVSFRIGRRTAADSARAARRAARFKCDSAGMRGYTRQGRDGSNPVRVSGSCDAERLARSPDLPASIYDPVDERFGATEMHALVAEALSMGAQAAFAPQPWHALLDRPRYNRVEGLSLGIRADEQLGAGYSLRASARVGLADREPNVELSGARTDLRRLLAVSAYNRLTPASDWGTPFTLGASINALLFARDEGYYYRASGVEFGSRGDDASGSGWSWTLFGEQQRSARVNTSFSAARALGGAAFDTNLVARREGAFGVRMRVGGHRGDDPQGLRLRGEWRGEAAAGTTSGGYGRLAGELTAAHGVGQGAAALTVAAGSSAGKLPSQRYWFLGGSQTVRGQAPGAADGSAFWLARAEVARGLGAVRPVAFADLGWAGDRTRWRDIGRPLSGAGIGLAVLDGILRVDVARGFNPVRQWRVESYVDARF